MKYYLAYGSNLNKAQMTHRCPGAESIGAALINDYELANIITSDKTADQIKSLMTVQVRFVIAAVK